jgi:hypothetical protein
MSETLTGALKEIAAKLGSWPEIPAAAYTDLREELIYRYAIGTGQFVVVNGTTYIEITTNLFTLDGEPDGTYLGVDEPVVPIMSVFQRPAPPPPPFDQPTPPVDHIPIQSWSKGVWTFGDGSSIFAQGPANLHAIEYVDLAHNLFVTGNQLIAGGTGKYEGCQGTKIVSGSSWVAAGVPFTATAPFSVKSVEGFRIIRKEYIA